MPAEKQTTIIIDGTERYVPAGSTILDACRQLGISIPTLCHLPRISAEGLCALCLVEVAGAAALVKACITTVAPGMDIRTDTERVINARRINLELLLAGHPLDCMTCDKSGGCEVADLAYAMGIKRSRFLPEKNLAPAPVPTAWDNNLLIGFDPAKCIHCGRCVNACRHQVVVEAIDFAGRGHRMQVNTPGTLPLEKSDCQFCGACIQVCPTGALTEKKAAGLARHWELTKVRTTCPYCGVGCQMHLHVKNGTIIKVTGVEDGAPNQGRLCVKGRFGYDFVYSPERLTTPLIKENGKFQAASWDEALDLVAEKFKAIIAQHGPDAVAGVSCARSINEDSYYMQKLFRAVFRTNNIDHCARSCHAPTVAGLITTFGTGGMTNSLAEFSRAKMLVCIGTNMTEAHPVAATFVKNAVRKGAKLVVVDPRRLRLADYADIYAQIRVGSDVAFINGIMHVLITEDLYDHEFVRDHCVNFDQLKTAVQAYPPERAAEISSVPADKIREIARLMAAIRPCMVIYTLGITEHTCGTNNVMALADLQMLLGNIGKECGGVNPLRGQNNVQGACDMAALPNTLPGYQKISDPAARAKFAQAWGVEALPEKEGLMIPRMLGGLVDKSVRALYVFGENLAQTEPDIKSSEHCLGAAEFLVCQDIFMTETTQFADVVLPAACWGEDEGTFANCERRVSLVRKVKEPPGLARPNWWIFKELAKRFGHTWEANSAREIWDNEFSVLAPLFAGIKYQRIQGDGIQWPCPAAEHPGTPILHLNGLFTHGKGAFQSLAWTPPAEVADKEYPFVLSTGRRLQHYHSRTQTGRSKGLNELLSEEFADISVEDAQRLGIQDGEMIVVRSRRGRVEVKAHVSRRIPLGLVWMSFHFREGSANWLTNTAYDTKTQTAEFKACAVAIEKI